MNGQRTQRRVAGRFALASFMEDMEEIRQSRGVSMRALCQQTGIGERSYGFMKAGQMVPGGDTLAALCLWSGLDANHYFVRAEVAA